MSSLLIRWKRISYRSQEFLHKFGEALVFIFLSIAVSGIMADVFKPLLGRARPLLWEREGVYTFHPWSFHSLWNSMPSGHATTAMSLYFVATALVPRGRYVWLVGALILASSRVMVNAHYLSDIIAGTAVAFLSIWLVEKLLERYREPLFKKYLLPLSKKEIL